jgi:hypothetical protein
MQPSYEKVHERQDRYHSLHEYVAAQNDPDIPLG